MSQLHFRLCVLTVRVAEERYPGFIRLMSQHLGSICVKMVEIFVTFLGPPDEADKNAAPISVSPDKLARLPTFFILETHFLRDRIFGCSCRLLSFPKDLCYFGHQISLRERVANRVTNQLTRNSNLTDELTIRPLNIIYPHRLFVYTVSFSQLTVINFPIQRHLIGLCNRICEIKR